MNILIPSYTHHHHSGNKFSIIPIYKASPSIDHERLLNHIAHDSFFFGLTFASKSYDFIIF